MKIFRLFTVCILILGMGSCATMMQNGQSSSTVSTNSTAYTAGAACGNAIIALYSQYKVDGKINLSNSNNLIHLATLAGSSAYLKANSKDKAYFQDFAKGTISGSQNMITTALADKMLGSLSQIDLSSLNQKAAATSQTAETVSSVVNILKLLKQ